MKHLVGCVFLLGATILPGCGSSSPTTVAPVQGPPPEALSILFLGNSLTYFNDLPGMVRELLEEAQTDSVVVASVSFPNYGLMDHWVDGRSRAALATGGWDFVAMQQGPSATEGRPSLLDYAQRFEPEIRAGGGVPALYMVWPAEARFFDFDGVADSYKTAAELAGGVLFPAGDAWRQVWQSDSTAALYSPDRFHPSTLGSYVAALTIAHRIVGDGFAPDHDIDTGLVRVNLEADYGALLLEAVRASNARYAELGVR